MIRRSRLVRFIVPACSLLLLSGYVAYRATGNPFAAPAPQTGEPPQREPAVFHGSKSAAVFEPPAAPDQRQAESRERFMGGSKREAVIEPADVKPRSRKPAQQPQQITPP